MLPCIQYNKLMKTITIDNNHLLDLITECDVRSTRQSFTEINSRINLPGVLVLDPNAPDFNEEDTKRRYNLDLSISMPRIELVVGEKRYIKYFTTDEFMIIVKDKLDNWSDLVSPSSFLQKVTFASSSAER